MYGPFTNEVVELMSQAAETADRFSQQHLSAGHIVLSVLALRTGLAAKCLQSINADTGEVHGLIENRVRRATPEPYTEIASGKRAIEYAIREANEMGHERVSTGHVLLGCLADEEEFAANCLADCDIDPLRLENEVRQTLNTWKPNETEKDS